MSDYIKKEKEKVFIDTKEEAIQAIRKRFPVDSRDIEKAQIGIALLEKARRKVDVGRTWEDESEDVLIEYAKLCIDAEYDAIIDCRRII